jgi:hypothetical protein
MMMEIKQNRALSTRQVCFKKIRILKINFGVARSRGPLLSVSGVLKHLSSFNSMAVVFMLFKMFKIEREAGFDYNLYMISSISF